MGTAYNTDNGLNQCNSTCPDHKSLGNISAAQIKSCHLTTVTSDDQTYAKSSNGCQTGNKSNTYSSYRKLKMRAYHTNYNTFDNSFCLGTTFISCFQYFRCSNTRCPGFFGRENTGIIQLSYYKNRSCCSKQTSQCHRKNGVGFSKYKQNRNSCQSTVGSCKTCTGRNSLDIILSFQILKFLHRCRRNTGHQHGKNSTQNRSIGRNTYLTKNLHTYDGR